MHPKGRETNLMAGVELTVPGETQRRCRAVKELQINPSRGFVHKGRDEPHALIAAPFAAQTALGQGHGVRGCCRLSNLILNARK